jgi:hypothetical protein
LVPQSALLTQEEIDIDATASDGLGLHAFSPLQSNYDAVVAEIAGLKSRDESPESLSSSLSSSS